MSAWKHVQSLAIVVALLTASIALFRSPQPEAQLFATAAHASKNVSLATVPIDDGVEAIVVLDHITLEMTGYVMNPFTGHFFAGYYTQIANEFGVQQGKRPEFTLVGGHVDFRRFSDNQRPADGVVYVAETNSGKMVAYSIPWNRTFRSNPPPVARAPFIALDRTRIRSLPLPP